MMRTLRKEDLSLYYYIKDLVLLDFREKEEGVTLSLVKELSGSNSYVYDYDLDIIPTPRNKGRGFSYFDDPDTSVFCSQYTSVSGLNGVGDSAYGTPEQSSKVVVYEVTSSGIGVVPWLDYMIDYEDCRIVSSRSLNNPTIDFEWNYISVLDEWQDIYVTEPPVVVINVSDTEKVGYQLGGGKQTRRGVELHVFASSSAERNDITDILYDGLYRRSCPLFNFNTGTVLDYDGTFFGRKNLTDRISNPNNKLTYLFDRELISGVSKLKFENVKANNVNLPLVTQNKEEVTLSDLNAFRSKISFTMFSYDERNIIGNS